MLLQNNKNIYLDLIISDWKLLIKSGDMNLLEGENARYKEKLTQTWFYFINLGRERWSTFFYAGEYSVIFYGIT